MWRDVIIVVLDTQDAIAHTYESRLHNTRHQANLCLDRTQIFKRLFPRLALQNMNSWNPVLVYVLMFSPSWGTATVSMDG